MSMASMVALLLRNLVMVDLSSIEALLVSLIRITMSQFIYFFKFFKGFRIFMFHTTLKSKLIQITQLTVKLI